jgi:hypothetical protein
MDGKKQHLLFAKVTWNQSEKKRRMSGKEFGVGEGKLNISR